MRAAVMSMTLVVTLFASCGSALAQSPPSAELQEDIRAMLDVIGVASLSVHMLNQIIGPMKQAIPSVPEEFWTEFMARVDTRDLIEAFTHIYAKYYTHDEIKQLLVFYRTPLGQKLIATLPAVTQECMLAGQRWGEQLGQQIVDELEAKGYKYSQM